MPDAPTTTRFTDKAVFITGAGTGIGRAAALAFAAEGARVAVAGLPGPDLEETARLVGETGAQVLALECDVTDEQQVQDALARTVEAFGRLDVAFNNAGVEQERTPIAELATSDWNRLLAVDLTGVYHCLKHQVPLLRAAGGVPS